MDSVPLSRYVPPTGEEPLDAVERALVRMLVDIIVAGLKAEGIAEEPKDRQETAGQFDAR
jgi:hypothetical protein